MGPARFLCATLLNECARFTEFKPCQKCESSKLRISLIQLVLVFSMKLWQLQDEVNVPAFIFTKCKTQVRVGELAHLVERSLCMREGPGSTPGFSNLSSRCEQFCQQMSLIVIYYFNFTTRSHQFILGSIVVSIPACHAGDRGSIPRRGGVKKFVDCVLVILCYRQFNMGVVIGLDMPG